jgi:uncharacterized protein YjeT (DUF2065 family)
MSPGKILLLAIALMLIAEGLFPLLAPGGWRAVFTQLVSLKNGQIRYIGLASVAAGLVLLGLLSFWG